MTTKIKFTDPKQVIIARRDLMMPDGKLAAQVAHASVACLLSKGIWTDKGGMAFGPDKQEFRIDLYEESKADMAMMYWMRESFPKIVLGVNSQEEMEELYSEFQISGLPCSKIIDSGRTVYDGVHHLTCIAIGPADRPSIDKITGHLPLYVPWDIEKEGVPAWKREAEALVQLLEISSAEARMGNTISGEELKKRLGINDETE